MQKKFTKIYIIGKDMILKMDIEQQFNLIAEEYDSNRRRFIPCFDDFYKNTTELIVSKMKNPKRRQ